MRQPDEQAKSDPTTEADARWNALLLVSCVVLPTCLAVAHAGNMADAAHDEAMIRAVGLGWTGAWRALDAPWYALFSWVPLGTRAMRAALATALACGGGGACVSPARACDRVPDRRAEAHGHRRGSGRVLGRDAVACLADRSDGLRRLVTGGGARAPAAGGRLERRGEASARTVTTALLAGLAVSYEPLVGLAAVSSLVAWDVLRRAERGACVEGRYARARRRSFAVGCAPLGVALAPEGAPAVLDGARRCSRCWRASEGRASPGCLVALLHATTCGMMSGVAVVARSGICAARAECSSARAVGC